MSDKQTNKKLGRKSQARDSSLWLCKKNQNSSFEAPSTGTQTSLNTGTVLDKQLKPPLSLVGPRDWLVLSGHLQHRESGCDWWPRAKDPCLQHLQILVQGLID